MEYRGLIVKEEKTCYLFTELSKGDYSFGIPLTDSEKIYVNLQPNQLNYCTVQFCDGTEPKPFESFENLEDIFFKIQDISIVTLTSTIGQDVVVINDIKKEGTEILNSLFNDVKFA